MFKDGLLTRASRLNKAIVFPEGEDLRIFQAAYECAQKKICRPILISRHDVFEENRRKLQLPEPGFQVLSPEFETDKDADHFFEKRKHKDTSREKAAETVKHTAFKGALMVDRGDADACVCGAVFTTGETVRAAIQCIGMKPGIQTVSSFFLMIWDHRTLLYSDCAVIPEPTANQLVDIAIASADSWKKMTATEPEVALLSFSTYGSAEHASIVPILQALKKIKERQPDLHVDGELQADAALVEAIGKRKAPGCQIAGKANVLIFPNLHAGNICYKITERLAGATAVGPILQGLAKPMNDLSRGCSMEDAVLAAAISALQSQN